MSQHQQLHILHRRRLAEQNQPATELNKDEVRQSERHAHDHAVRPTEPNHCSSAGECRVLAPHRLTTKLHLAVDAAGLPLAVILTPGKAGDNPQLLPLLDDIGDIDVDRQRVRVGRVIADKAKGSAGGRPPDFDPDLYKLRNVVERCFNRLKQFRGLATRFPKRAAYHRAEIILACIVLHLR
ncbi:transposase [Lentzea kentuckyensis]|uniref:transposase n=1 Tax=Lentzea kentuckyensis TaxID=360086 RepID=UPI00117A1AAB|nr:transposase [Lentzea kentuckyensis]